MARPTRLPIDPVRAFVTRETAAHPRDLSRLIAAEFGVSRAGVAPVVRRLEQEGFIRRTSSGTRPLFKPGASRFVHQRLPLPGVDESLLWEQHFAPYLALAAEVANTSHYVFTEMVNNANDHAGGTRLDVQAMQTLDTLYLVIRDDGLGVFRRIAHSLEFDDERLAVLELAKGKFTSDPAQHTGEGIFFASRAADAFVLRANGLEYRRQDGAAAQHNGLDRVGELAPPGKEGTTVAAAISLDSPRRLRELFNAYTTGAPDDLTFDRTVIPVRLARIGDEQLLSRSQAKRLIARFESFRRVELDFAGVSEVGQAFADELFRVFPAAYPEVELLSSNAEPAVLAMLRRAAPALRNAT